MAGSMLTVIPAQAGIQAFIIVVAVTDLPPESP
jgi:hypothetical protein